SLDDLALGRPQRSIVHQSAALPTPLPAHFRVTPCATLTGAHNCTIPQGTSNRHCKIDQRSYFGTHRASQLHHPHMLSRGRSGRSVCPPDELSQRGQERTCIQRPMHLGELVHGGRLSMMASLLTQGVDPSTPLTTTESGLPALCGWLASEG